MTRPPDELAPGDAGDPTGEYELKETPVEPIIPQPPAVPIAPAVNPDASDSSHPQSAAREARMSRRKRSSRGVSRLGLLGMLLGVAACVLCRRSLLPPNIQISPVPLAVIGITLGLLGLAGIVIGTRAGAGLPFLAILLGLTALGIAAYEDGIRNVPSAQGWVIDQYSHYRARVASEYDHLVKSAQPSQATTPPASQASPPAPGQSTPGSISDNSSAYPPSSGNTTQRGDPDAGVGAGTIFDMRQGSNPAKQGNSQPSGSPSPGDIAAPAARAPGSNVLSPARSAQIAPAVISAQAALQSALAKVKGVEDNFRFAFENSGNADYLAAKQEVVAADRQVEDAKLRSDGFGQPLIDATRIRKEAQEKVARIENDAMAHDPVVAAARRELAAAEQAVRDAYRSTSGNGR